MSSQYPPAKLRLSHNHLEIKLKEDSIGNEDAPKSPRVSLSEVIASLNGRITNCQESIDLEQRTILSFGEQIRAGVKEIEQLFGDKINSELSAKLSGLRLNQKASGKENGSQKKKGESASEVFARFKMASEKISRFLDAIDESAQRSSVIYQGVFEDIFSTNKRVLSELADYENFSKKAIPVRVKNTRLVRFILEKEKENENLKRQMSASPTMLELKKRNHSLKTKINEQGDQLSHFKNHHSLAKTVIPLNLPQIDPLNKATSELKEQIRSLLNENDSLKFEVKELKDKQDKMRMDFACLLKERFGFKTKLAMNSTEIVKKEMKSLLEENLRLQLSLKKMESKAHERKVSLKKLFNIVTEKDKEVKKLRARMQEIATKGKEAQDLKELMAEGELAKSRNKKRGEVSPDVAGAGQERRRRTERQVVEIKKEVQRLAKVIQGTDEESIKKELTEIASNLIALKTEIAENYQEPNELEPRAQMHVRFDKRIMDKKATKPEERTLTQTQQEKYLEFIKDLQNTLATKESKIRELSEMLSDFNKTESSPLDKSKDIDREASSTFLFGLCEQKARSILIVLEGAVDWNPLSETQSKNLGFKKSQKKDPMDSSEMDLEGLLGSIMQRVEFLVDLNREKGIKMSKIEKELSFKKEKIDEKQKNKVNNEMTLRKKEEEIKELEKKVSLITASFQTVLKEKIKAEEKLEATEKQESSKNIKTASLRESEILEKGENASKFRKISKERPSSLDNRKNEKDAPMKKYQIEKEENLAKEQRTATFKKLQCILKEVGGIQKDAKKLEGLLNEWEAKSIEITSKTEKVIHAQFEKIAKELSIEKNKVLNLSKNLESLKISEEEKDTQIQGLKKDNAELAKNCQELSRNIEELNLKATKENENLLTAGRNVQEQKESLLKELEDVQSSLKNKTLELQKAQELNEKIQKELNGPGETKIRDDLMEKINSLEAEVYSKEKELSECRETDRKKEEKIKELKDKVERVKAKKKDVFRGLECKLKEKEAEIHQIESKREEKQKKDKEELEKIKENLKEALENKENVQKELNAILGQEGQLEEKVKKEKELMEKKLKEKCEVEKNLLQEKRNLFLDLEVIKKEKENALKELNETRENCKDLHEKISELEEEKAKISQEKEKLAVNMREIENKNKETQEEISRLKGKNKKLEDALDSKKDELDRAKQALETGTRVEKDKEEFTLKMVRKKEKIRQLKKEVQNQREDLEKLKRDKEKSLIEWREKNSVREEKDKEMDKTLEEVKRKLEQKENELSQRELSIMEARKEKNTLEMERNEAIRDLESKQLALNDSKKETEDLKRQLEHAQRDLVKIKEENQGSREIQSETKLALEDKEKNLNNFSRQLEITQGELTKEKEENLRLKEIQKEQRLALENTEKKLETLSRELEKTQCDLTKAKEVNDETKLTQNGLKLALEDSEKNSERLLGNLRRLEDERVELDANLRDLKQVESKKDEEIDELVRKLESVERELEENRKERREKTGASHKEEEKTKKMLEEKEMMIKKLESEIRKKEEELQNAKQNKEIDDEKWNSMRNRLEDKLIKLESELASCKLKVDSKKNKLKSMKQENTGQKQAIESLELQIKEASLKESEIFFLKEELEKLKSKVSRKKSKKTKLKESVDQLELTNKTLTEKIKALEASDFQKRTQSKGDPNEEIQRIKEQLEEFREALSTSNGTNSKLTSRIYFLMSSLQDLVKGTKNQKNSKGKGEELFTNFQKQIYKDEDWKGLQNKIKEALWEIKEKLDKEKNLADEGANKEKEFEGEMARLREENMRKEKEMREELERIKKEIEEKENEKQFLSSRVQELNGMLVEKKRSDLEPVLEKKEMLIEHFQEKIQKMAMDKAEDDRRNEILVKKCKEEIETLQNENARLILKMTQADSNRDEADMTENRMNQQIVSLKKEINDLRSRYEPIKNTFVKFLDGYTKNSKEYEDYLRTLTMMLGFLPNEQSKLVELSRPVAKKKFSIF